MYQFLRGIVAEKINDTSGSERLILDVNGIGYEIYTSLSVLDLIGKKGDSVTVYTTLVHKEDQMSLYGFPTLYERDLFNLLFSVSGIGPKSALSLLNNLTPSEITYAILNEDASSLKKANGVGQKTAERLVLELKEKIKTWKHLPIVNRGNDSEEKGQKNGNASLIEARSVLQALGYSTQEINKAFSEANGSHSDSESLIHFSLKWLSKVEK